MKLVDAKCPNCGAVAQVDKNKDASICEVCGAPFVVEKAINSYKKDNNDNNHKPDKINYNKIIACVFGYIIDALLIISAFFCGTVGKAILLSYVAILIIVCVIVKSIKQEKIKDGMAIFIGKWSLYISMLAFALIIELICFAFEVSFIGKVLDKIEK